MGARKSLHKGSGKTGEEIFQEAYAILDDEQKATLESWLDELRTLPSTLTMEQKADTIRDFMRNTVLPNKVGELKSAWINSPEFLAFLDEIMPLLREKK